MASEKNKTTKPNPHHSSLTENPQRLSDLCWLLLSYIRKILTRSCSGAPPFLQTEQKCCSN